MPRNLTVEELADQVELALLAGFPGRGSRELAAHLLPHLAPSTGMSRIEGAIDRMRLRSRMIGELYPFNAMHPTIPTSTEAGVYRDLLTLTLAGPSDPGDASAVLDEIAAAVLASLYGPGTQVFLFAHPVARVSDDPRPEDFPSAVRWLGSKMGLQVGNGFRQPTRQDGGVDLVALRVLGGNPHASPTAFVQTTVSSDLRKKARDIDVPLWGKWLDINPSTQVYLLVPYEVGRSDLEEMHGSGHLVLDRVRLGELLSSSRADFSLGPVSRLWADRQWESLTQRWQGSD